MYFSDSKGPIKFILFYFILFYFILFYFIYLFIFFLNFARNAPRTVHGLSLPLCNLFSFNASFFITLSKLSVLRTFDSLLDGIPSLAEFIFQ